MTPKRGIQRQVDKKKFKAEISDKFLEDGILKKRRDGESGYDHDGN